MTATSEEIKSLLASTDSELYEQIGIYLHELEFTTDILDDDNDFKDLFAETDDCDRIGIPTTPPSLKQFVIARALAIIKEFTTQSSNVLILRAQQLHHSLQSANSDVYREIGAILLRYQVHCADITDADHLKRFLSKPDIARMNLRNAAKQKLAFNKVLRIVKDTQKQALPVSTLTNAKQTSDDDDDDDRKAIPPTTTTMNNDALAGTVSNKRFWSHFFSQTKKASYDEFKQAVHSFIALKTNHDDVKTSSSFVDAIVLSVVSIERSSSSSSSLQQTSISYDAFQQYTEFFNADNVMECFDSTQSDFAQLHEMDRSASASGGQLASIALDTLEDTLFKIDIYGALLSDAFETNLWSCAVQQHFVASVPLLMKLAFKFEQDLSNRCGVVTLHSQLFSHRARMTELVSANKSSFMALSESQLLHVLRLDTLALNEEKLFMAVRGWCERDVKNAGKKRPKTPKAGSRSKSPSPPDRSSWEQRMRTFVPYLRFPVMSFEFLLTSVLPIKTALFTDVDDLLWILAYKLSVSTMSKKKKFEFDLKKLCCAHTPRGSGGGGGGDVSATEHAAGLSVEERLVKVLAENEALRQKNEELKDKNHKLKTKVVNEKAKRSNHHTDVSSTAANSASTTGSAAPSSSSSKRDRTRSNTNMFTTVDHFAKMHQKKQSVSDRAKFGHAQDDSTDFSAPHIRQQVSMATITNVENFEQGDTTVNFLVKFAEEETEEAKEMFETMRKKMTDRSMKVKSAAQRKKEKEEREQLQKLKEEEDKKKKKKKKKMSAGAENDIPIEDWLVPKASKKDKPAVEENDGGGDGGGGGGGKHLAMSSISEEPQDTNAASGATDANADANADAVAPNETPPTANQANENVDVNATNETSAAAAPPNDHNTNTTNVSNENVNNELLSEPSVSVVENTYGYAQIHEAFKAYYVAHNTECTNPTHLILYSKKNGIAGVSFASTNKYFKARKADPDVVTMEQLFSPPTNKEQAPEQAQPQANEDDNINDNTSDGSGHSVQKEEDALQQPQEASPLTITQSTTDNAPIATTTSTPEKEQPESKQQDEDSSLQSANSLQSAQSLKNNPSGSSKKKKKPTMEPTAENIAQLKKTTPYTRFSTPLYATPLSVAERKKSKDDLRALQKLNIQIGYVIQLKTKNQKATVKYIGEVHFVYGLVIGLEVAGNGNGRHAGEVDKIKYFDGKVNGGLFVRVDDIDKILERKKYKANKKFVDVHKETMQRVSQLMAQEYVNEELDLSELSKKEQQRLQRFHFEIGDVVEVDKGRKGILHYYGKVHWTEDIIFGVEFLGGATGKYNGTYGDVQYFECPEKRGMFFTSANIRKPAARLLSDGPW